MNSSNLRTPPNSFVGVCQEFANLCGAIFPSLQSKAKTRIKQKEKYPKTRIRVTVCSMSF